MENEVLENDPVFSEVQLRQAGTQSPLVPTDNPGSSAITSISSGSSGIGASVVGGVATLVSPLTAKGDIFTRSSTAGTRLAAAANDARLTTDSAEATGLKWIAASTGWGAASGTLSRAAYASYAGQTVSNPPTQAEMQALDDAVKLLSRTVVALVTDLTTQKVIKA